MDDMDLSLSDDILDFNLDEFDDNTVPSSDDLIDSFPEFAEEELEWLSNKDAFPAVETCLDILNEPPPVFDVLNHLSPVSVLENSTNSSNSTITNCCSSLQATFPPHPVRKRSKCTKRRSNWCFKQDLPLPQLSRRPPVATTIIGRRCQHCLTETTPQWRAGPMGPKTLCNACGVRYKSGRLVPEYRPVNSPTYSSVLHSNSHRKIMEMRKHKQLGSMTRDEACGYSRIGI